MSGKDTRLRLLGTAESAPLLTFDAANDAFRAEWTSARDTYLELLASLGGHWVRKLYSRGPIQANEVRYARRQAQEITDHALALVAALDAAERVPARYLADREGRR